MNADMLERTRMQEQQWTIATSAEKLSDIKENLVSVA
jgi:hypothetical protein